MWGIELDTIVPVGSTLFHSRAATRDAVDFRTQHKGSVRSAGCLATNLLRLLASGREEKLLLLL